MIKIGGQASMMHDSVSLELRKNAIGMWQIVFFVIAAAAPLTGMLGIIPVAN
jgi:hypothetical protein